MSRRLLAVFGLALAAACADGDRDDAATADSLGRDLQLAEADSGVTLNDPPATSTTTPAPTTPAPSTSRPSTSRPARAAGATADDVHAGRARRQDPSGRHRGARDGGHRNFVEDAQAGPDGGRPRGE